MRAIVVVQDGRIIAETYGEGFSVSTPLLGWSMTKTVNAALAGVAIKDGSFRSIEKIYFRSGPATRVRISRWPI